MTEPPISLEPEPPLPKHPAWMDPHHARLAFSRQRLRGGSLVENWRMVAHEPLPAGPLKSIAEWRLEALIPQEADI